MSAFSAEKVDVPDVVGVVDGASVGAGVVITVKHTQTQTYISDGSEAKRDSSSTSDSTADYGEVATS